MKIDKKGKFLILRNYVRRSAFPTLKVFLCALPAWFFLLLGGFRNGRPWLIAERRNEARDNGSFFYNYLLRNDIVASGRLFYAIDLDAPDVSRLDPKANLVQFASWKHAWIYALCRVSASTHVYGASPSLKAVRYIKWLLPRKIQVFLRHGVSKDSYKLYLRKDSGMDLMICGAKREWEYLAAHTGYPEGGVVWTGIPRHDALVGLEGTANPAAEGDLLFFPTFRRWLVPLTLMSREDGYKAFRETDYYKKIDALLNSGRLAALLEKHNRNLLVVFHSAAGFFSDAFSLQNSRVRIKKMAEVDIQSLIKKSSSIITDYSSVAFDFAYQGKPVVYYQFDRHEYRSGHYEEGYYSYDNDGFGPIFEDSAEVIGELENVLSSASCLSPEYRERVEDFFPRRDDRNCERVFQAIQRAAEV